MPGLELSGDLRFRGPKGIRKTRRVHDGRPYVLARKGKGRTAQECRAGRVMLHRAVMSVLLGRELSPGELVCHRDDVSSNNWPANLYVGDAKSNAADGVRNGLRPRGDQHPQAKLSDKQVRLVRRALASGERGKDLARALGVHKSTISRIKHGVRRRSC